MSDQPRWSVRRTLSACVPRHPSDVLWILALALIYWGAATLSLRWAVVPGAGTAFWPAAGVATAVLVARGPQLWPGIILGRLATAYVVDSPQPLWADFVIAVGTMLGSLLPVLLMRALRIDPSLRQLRGAMWLVLGASAGGATVSAGIGALVLLATGSAAQQVGSAALNWWFGFGTGVITFTPLFLSWRPGAGPAIRGQHFWHFVVVFLANLLLSYLIFLRPELPPYRAWFVFPLLTWAALAFSVRGGSAASLATALTAFVAATRQVGPLAGDALHPEDTILLTQQFVGIMSGTTLLMASVADERRGREQLRRSEQRLRAETEALEVLNRTAAAIAAELDLDRAVQTVTDAGVALSGAQFGAFFFNVLDADGQHYSLYTLSGAERAAFEGLGHPRNTAVFAPTFAGEGVVRVDDITKDPRYGARRGDGGMPSGHLPVRAYLAAPVKSRSGEVIGALLFGHSTPGVFTERAERLVTAIAVHAAIAIDNARLFQAAQREISERRRAEEHQRLLINELNHRVKNTLATVQSIGAQTLRTSGDGDPRAAFEARLIALSAAHNLLTDERWQGAELGEVARAAALPFGATRFAIEGPMVRLNPAEALALAMAFHELGTNAVKYGALSSATGAVKLGWTRSDAGEVVIEWCEEGGPPVRQPTRSGFGSRLVRHNLARELTGEVTLDFRSEGVCCRIAFRPGRTREDRSETIAAFAS